jgi:MoaA/NifB/PqqE/SkfB family radical SAM enzyme
MISSVSAAPGLNRGLRLFFSELLRVSLRRPAQALFFARTLAWQAQAAHRRARMAREGVSVPPIAIFSITNHCNLRCKGCYAHALRGDSPDELSVDALRSIVAQADEAGISFFVIAGGEPLTRPEIVEIAGDFPRIVFLLVTNGILLDEELIQRLARIPNVVPVLSIEGTQAETDGRRGQGVYARLEQRMQQLRAAGLFFSLSLTVTRANYDLVTDPGFLRDSVRRGCRLFLMLEYTPLQDGSDEWVLTDVQRDAMKARVASFRRDLDAVFVAVPWDEEEQGGCLAAGRGFVHISATGDLEPCPFAPYSDANLRSMPLKEALRSPFLASMRDNHQSFAETAGGCALWKNREEVRRLLAARGRGAEKATQHG